MPRFSPARVSEAVADGSSAQLLTVVVMSWYGRANSPLVVAAFRSVAGVLAVEADQKSPRVWVFGDGTVDTEALRAAASPWAERMDVLEDRIATPD